MNRLPISAVVGRFVLSKYFLADLGHFVVKAVLLSDFGTAVR